MRWNGVFGLGLGISATGFAAMAYAYTSAEFAGSTERLMTIAAATLTAGFLVTVIGAFLSQKRPAGHNGQRKGAKRFGGNPSHSGQTGREFGKRDGQAPTKSRLNETHVERPPLLALLGPRLGQ